VVATKGEQQCHEVSKSQRSRSFQNWVVEVEVACGKIVAESGKKIGVAEQTYYRWKKKFGGLRVDQAKRLK
jgi:hypothetical protein